MRKMELFSDALASLGHDIAAQAVQQNEEAQANWSKLTTMLKLAQSMGMGQEAFEALYSAGDRLQQRKAIWYRRQKRVIKDALEYGIDLTDRTMKEAEDLVLEAREAAKTDTQREADAMRMLERSMKGAVNASQNKDKVLDLVLGRPSRKRATRKERAH